MTTELAGDGAAPYAIPIGGSTAVGAVGYAVAFVELMQQCDAAAVEPAAVVFTSSSGGTHAGLVAGHAIWRSLGHHVPDVVGIGVAKGVNIGMPDVAELAGDVLGLCRAPAAAIADDIELDPSWIGSDYAVPTAAGDDAVLWAARQGGWVLDRTYSGKGMSGLLGQAAAGRWSQGDSVIFIHTGGMPAVFVPGGAPPLT